MGFDFGSITEGAVKGFVGSIGDIIKLFKVDPTVAVQLQQQLEMKAMDFAQSTIQSVNATMQAEAKSEHWAQWSWRPIVGFTFAGTILNNYVLYSYFAKFGMVQIVIPDTVWLAMLTILGAAAYTRGQEKVARLNGNNK